MIQALAMWYSLSGDYLSFDSLPLLRNDESEKNDRGAATQNHEHITVRKILSKFHKQT